MSIKKCLQEQQPGHARLAKALSWHYPNREYINSLLLEKKQQELEYTILRIQLESSKLDGRDESEKLEQLRIRLSRLNSLNPTKTTTKLNSGSIQAAFRNHEQNLDSDFIGKNYSEPPKPSNAQYDYQQKPKPTNPESGSNEDSFLKAFKRGAVPSLKETVSFAGELAQGRATHKAQGKPTSLTRKRSSSSASRMALPEMAEVLTSSPEKVNKPQGSSNATKPISPTNAEISSSAPNQEQPHTPNSPRVNAWDEPGAPRIPAGLSEQEKGVYRKLIRVRKARMVAKSPVPPPRVLVITDLGKDYDDLAAMVVLKELHRIGLIELVGFIANLHPPQERAKFGRGCLDSLGLEDIPIAWGEEAQADPSKRTPPEDYEFPMNNDYFSSIYAKDATFTPYNQEKANEAEIESGVKLLDRLVYARVGARPRGQKPKTPFTLLLLSGLADIATYAKREPENLAKATVKVVLQGGYSIEQGPTSYHAILAADLSAANNGFDRQAATEWHQYMDNHHIPSVVYTRAAAVKARLPPTVFDELRHTMHPIGQHLSAIQRTQDTHYYENACDPAKRFMPRLDGNWFLDTKTNWYDKHPDDNRDDPTTKPVGAAVLKYVELVCYDALAALGTAGDDVLRALDLLEPKDLFAVQGPHIHKIVGRKGEKKEKNVVVDPGLPDINQGNMKLALTALLKGSLMAVQEGISSKHTSGLMWKDANTLAAESAAIGTGGGT